MSDGWFLVEKNENLIWVPEEEADGEEDVMFLAYFRREVWRATRKEGESKWKQL